MIDDVLVAFVKTTEAFLKLIFTKEPKERKIQQDTRTHTALPVHWQNNSFFSKYFGTYTYKL